MSQQEDDLRALAKIMDMLRGVSIVLVVANIYWFSQNLVGGWRFHHETMKVLGNLNDRDRSVFRTLFESEPYDFNSESERRQSATYEKIIGRSTRQLKRELGFRGTALKPFTRR